MEYLTKKNSKTAQSLENQIKDKKSKEIEKNKQTTFSYFYSMLPNEILGVPISEIKRDISDISYLSS
jgi:hypothetical protein